MALCHVLLLPMSASAASPQPPPPAEPSNTTTPSAEVSSTGTEARISGCAYGISGLERLNKGTNRQYNGASYGYRFPMVAQNAFAVVLTNNTHALVYLPYADNNGVMQSLSPAQFQEMLLALDQHVANGGTMLANMDLSYQYTSEPSLTVGAFRYDFAVELEPGHYYACITALDGSDNSAGALFCESGLLLPVDQVAITTPPTGLAALGAFLTSLDMRPFWVSLKTSLVALFFVFFLGLGMAWLMMGINNRFKTVLDAILTIPLVLPPTVCGFLLLIVFGNSTAFGRWLLSHGIELIFSWPAAVLAAIVVSFPLMYRTARGAFEALDPAISDAARTLGWSEPRIFMRLSMPLAWPSIAAGTVLAFARALGEFGATLFVAGNYPGVTQTIPIAIYFEWMGGHSQVATFWVFVVIVFSFIVILFVNLYASHTQRYRVASADKEDTYEPSR